jgi:hypothetical protein
LVDAIERWTCMAKAVSVGNSPLTPSTDPLPLHEEQPQLAIHFFSDLCVGNGEGQHVFKGPRHIGEQRCSTNASYLTKATSNQTLSIRPPNIPIRRCRHILRHVVQIVCI